MPVTLKDVAKRVGRSITTVSRALNDYDDVSEETRKLVKQVAQEMGYVPSSIAQKLQKNRADTLGFILPTFGPRFSDPFFSDSWLVLAIWRANIGLISWSLPAPLVMKRLRLMWKKYAVAALMGLSSSELDGMIHGSVYSPSTIFPSPFSVEQKQITTSPWLTKIAR
jgi:transcriptional regulator with XRE-family HTH domain